MNVTQCTAAIIEAYASRQPLMFWGPPGVGKSSAGRAAARILNEMHQPPKGGKQRNTPLDVFGFVDLRLSLMEPTQLLGVQWPDPTKGELRHFKPDFLPTEGKGILMLDEIVQASQLMQGAASQLVLDRCLGRHRLGDGWLVIAAGNRLSDRSATNAMPMHMRNRFIHLYTEVDNTSWISWALEAEVDVRVIAFMKFRPKLLHVFDPQAKGEAFPTPRSWEFVSNVLKKWTSSDRGLLETMIRGAVGDGAGTEFCGFLRVADKMPSIDGILMNPKTAAIPDDMAVMYAVTTGLIGRATKDNLASVTAYFNRVADQGKPDFAMAAIKELTARKDGNALSQTKAFIEFSAKHAHLMA